MCLGFVLALILMNPENAFAAGVAQCGASGIDATKWDFSSSELGTSAEAGHTYDQGATLKKCCQLGAGQTLRYACDVYTIKPGAQQNGSSSSGTNNFKDTDPSSAISCDGKYDISNYSFDFTQGGMQQATSPEYQNENTTVCCKMTASAQVNGGTPIWTCTYYTSNQVIDDGYQTEADKAEEEKAQEEREDLGDLRGDLNANCDAIFDSEAQALIERLFNIICIAVPILLIVLGSVDFGNAVLSSDQEAMQKAVKRFTTRCIIAVAIFFLPMLVNLIFSFPGMDAVKGVVFCDV